MDIDSFDTLRLILAVVGFVLIIVLEIMVMVGRIHNILYESIEDSSPERQAANLFGLVYIGAWGLVAAALILSMWPDRDRVSNRLTWFVPIFVVTTIVSLSIAFAAQKGRENESTSPIAGLFLTIVYLMAFIGMSFCLSFNTDGKYEILAWMFPPLAGVLSLMELGVFWWDAQWMYGMLPRILKWGSYAAIVIVIALEKGG